MSTNPQRSRRQTSSAHRAMRQGWGWIVSLAFSFAWPQNSLAAQADSAREQAQRQYLRYASLDGPVREAMASFEAQRKACEASKDGSEAQKREKTSASRAPAPKPAATDPCQTLPDQERRMWRQVRPLLEQQSQSLERAYCFVPSFQFLFLMAQVLEMRRLTTQATQLYQEFNHCLDRHMHEQQRQGQAGPLEHLDHRCGPSWEEWDDKKFGEAKELTNARLQFLAPAPDQLIERFNALAPLREQCQVWHAPAKRPAWRIGVGFTGLLLGAAAVAVGAFNLAQSPPCIAAPARPILDCERQAYPRPLDVALSTSGVLSIVAGALLWAWPPGAPRPRKEDGQ